MLEYEGNLFRPPSEAYSLILQVTVGCSHNQCTFCTMYKSKKFKVKSIKKIRKDIEKARKLYSAVKRIFLADGDALAMKTEELAAILEVIRETFPEVQRISAYGTAGNILAKSDDDLELLKELGLDMIYVGLESGSDEVLRRIKKGSTASEMIEAGKKIKKLGYNLSVTVISGMGGVELTEEHAHETAKVLNEMDPDYLGLLTLLVDKKSEIAKEIKEGSITLLEPLEVLDETRMLIENIKVTDCMFRSNHASNYFSLSGTLPRDTGKIISQIASYLIASEDGTAERHRRL